MTVTLELYEVKRIIEDAVKLGVAEARRYDAPAADRISQAEAWRRYGRKRVKRWRDKGYLAILRNGTSARSPVLYSNAELMTLDNAERTGEIFKRAGQDRAIAIGGGKDIDAGKAVDPVLENYRASSRRPGRPPKNAK